MEERPQTSCPERSDDVHAVDTLSNERTSCPPDGCDVHALDMMSQIDQIRLTRSDQIDEREGEIARERARATLAPIDPARELSQDGRAYAQSVGVTDVDGVFRDFRNHYLAEAKLSADWEALWRRWCDRELRIQRRERERKRAAPQSPSQRDPPGPRAWTMPPVIHLGKGKPS